MNYSAVYCGVSLRASSSVNHSSSAKLARYSGSRIKNFPLVQPETNIIQSPQNLFPLKKLKLFGKAFFKNMPRRKKNNKLNKNPAYHILLLVQIILIKLGNIPLTIMFSIGKFLSAIPPLPTPRLFHRHRGRPRLTPIIPFYKKRLVNLTNSILPKKVRTTIKIVGFLGMLYFYTQTAFSFGAELPSPERLKTPIQPLTTSIYDRNGILLYRIYEGRNRTLVNLGEVPSYLIQATIAAEDQNFYSHPGIDFMAILRAFWANVRYARQEGASTLTQQLIKNTLLTPEKTYIRKAKEIILALWAERLYSKNEILQMYLNEVPYGGTAYGIDAASLTYFGKKVQELTLAQAAYLAGLPASPTQFSPYGPNPSLAKLRQRFVLDRMVEEKYIDKKKADEAYAQNLYVKPPVNNIKAPHFVMYVRDLLSQKYGARTVSEGGLKVYTSLDLNLQEKAEKIVYEQVLKLGSLNISNGAAMITDAKTGQILAMIGSKDYNDPINGPYNVTTALRQPGSSIKPITYATAFKQGYSPGNTILDVPVTFKNAWGSSYSPVNYDGKYHGPVSSRVALASSYNIPAVKLLNTVGINSFLETAKSLGITTFSEPEKYGLSLTLGGAEVKMIDMMATYGTFANEGKYSPSQAILKVVDSNENVLEEAENSPKQVIDEAVAYLISDVLSDNNARTPAFGPNSQLNVKGKTVAVKTGTTDRIRDNWTFGYTPNYVVGVWVGNNDNTPLNPNLASGVTGAAPIWNEIMSLVLEGKEDQAFIKPATVKAALIDNRKDLVIDNIEPKGLVRVSQKDGQTTFSDPYSTYNPPSPSNKPQTETTNIQTSTN